MKNGITKKIAIFAVIMIILTFSNVVVYAYFNDLTREQTETIYLGEWLDGITSISTAQEFYDYITSPTSESTDVFVLENDIDFTGFNWTYNSTISNVIFKGTLDGNGHTISNLDIYTDSTSYNYFGLFPRTENATIKNINFDYVNLSLDNNDIDNSTMISGLIVGSIYGGENIFSNITINNSSVIGTSTNGTGGLIGQVYGSTSIVNIDSIKMSNLKVFSKSYNIGGLIGSVYGNSSSVNITNVDLQTELYSNSRASYLGGLIGRTISGSTINISNAIIDLSTKNTLIDYNSSLNDYSGKHLGGVIGYNLTSNLTISDTFITGELITRRTNMYRNVGTLIGRNSGSYTTENTYYSGVSFLQSNGSIDYYLSSTKGIMATQTPDAISPSLAWWNTFYTYFDSSIWSQDQSGKPILG